MEVNQKKRDVVTEIRDLMLDFNLVDIWRLMYGDSGTRLKSAIRGNKISP